MAKKILAASALAVATLGAFAATPAQAGVVVKASGPSSAQYPVGKKLDDMSNVTLKDGDVITVLTSTGTRIIKGPGTHRVGARGKSKNTAFALLTRQRAGARVRTGAVRGSGSAMASTNPSLWNIDISQSGQMCVTEGETISFWRPSTDGAETYMFKAAQSDFHVHVMFSDGDATASISTEELPLGQNLAYEVSGPDGTAPSAMNFVVLDTAPDNAEDMAVTLAESGCTGQLDLLATKLAVN
ncbi:hypothetical protein [Qipengyuania marisflavi]|uniref:Uncharacterized protein n=1 Tax=Qipengyuania marisflavi TaxID=2486356 RepID=A0A5S3P595_9SPHN|nr:hypothetical protein [Qipengyuania marisflavi]TMM47295.1 hypothetical protein FEV51_09500 [Qipengyuania marisflavi]